MPICPFCRKHVDPGSIWCSCGANLVRYPNLPVNSKDVKDWLAKYEPQFLASTWSGGSLLERAKRQLLSGQDREITATTRSNAELTEAKSLIKNFLLDCQREGLAPTIDIGSLRRDRWRQWKRVPAEYRQHAPLKNFRFTPGYFFETSVADFKDEYCLSVDGVIYKHQLNAPDPFELEELLKVVPANKLAEALAAAMVELLKAKQHPESGVTQALGASAEGGKAEPVPAQAAGPKSRWRLPFRRAKEEIGQPGPDGSAAAEAAGQIVETAALAAGAEAGIGAPEEEPAASTTPKRRVGKRDRRISEATDPVVPERRTGKTDRRTSAGAKKAPAERRTRKTDRRTGAAAKTTGPERRTGKTDRRGTKTAKEPALAGGISAAGKKAAGEPDNGSLGEGDVSLETTKT